MVAGKKCCPTSPASPAPQTASHAIGLTPLEHRRLQYLAQGACIALDAVTLGEAVRQCDFDMEAAFAVFQILRIARTARVLLSACEMGRLYRAQGVVRLVRDDLWKGCSATGFYDALQ